MSDVDDHPELWDTELVRVVLTYDKRPWSLNEERSQHWRRRHERVEEWRNAFTWLAHRANVPRLRWCFVEATPWLATRQHEQDTANCFPAVKAAIDGLIDVKKYGRVLVRNVLADDGPDVVRRITFHRPEIGHDALDLLIEGIPA